MTRQSRMRERVRLIQVANFANVARMTLSPESTFLAQAEHYQTHLNRVSRSFAFCIERLDLPLRAHVGLSYLLCRILDTIEDAPWTSWSLQKAAFDAFETFMSDRASAATEAGQVARWRATFPQAIPEGERDLLDDAERVFGDFHGLSQDVREVLLAPILSMARGMRHFVEQAGAGSLRLNSLADVNQYCFFVAGVVGEILTRLLWIDKNARFRDGDGSSSHVDLEDAFHFGLFLQKVNLLKDQFKDEPEGRFLVPSRKAVFASMVRDGERAIRYLLSLPVSQVSYRLFCGWSLFLGLASMPWIEESNALGDLVKIPRERTRELLGEVESIVKDDEALRGYFDLLMTQANEILRAMKDDTAKLASALAPRSEVMDLYEGALSREALVRLMSADPLCTSA